MSEADILDRLKALAQERLATDVEIEPASRLVEDLGLDSLRLQALAIDIENHFRICIEPEEEEAIVTVADLVEVVGSKTIDSPEVPS
jgi:acyl carrier protein